MEWTKVDLDASCSSQFSIRTIPGYVDILTKPPNEQGFCDYIGGIINDGGWGWLTRRNAEKAELQIYWLKSGDTMANYTFCQETNTRSGQFGCSICAVVELRSMTRNALPLLAVSIKTPQAKTKLAIYSPICSQALRYIDLDMAGINANTLTYVDASICNKNNFLKQYDGCLALGTVDGSLLLIDLNLQHLNNTVSSNVMLPDCHVHRVAAMFLPVYNVFIEEQLNATLLLCRKQDKHMVLVLDMPSAVRSSIVKIQIIDIVSGLVAALEDGRVFIYDLTCFQLVVELANSQGVPPQAVHGLCYILPPDDPQPCFYVCVVFNEGDFLIASLHVVNYQRFAFPKNNNQVFRTCDFRSTALRIRLVLDNGNCSLNKCKAVSTFPLRGDNGTLLIAISWHSQVDKTNKLMLFDINQWYRDEMPSSVRCDVKPNYLCGLVLSGQYSGLDLQINTKSIVHFAGMRRHDAYFYPNALSFDCTLMAINGCLRYVHEGVQRRFLNTLYYQKANLFLDPQPFLAGIVQCCLSPQYCKHNANAPLTGHGIYEVVLSVALEQDSNSLLYSCARYCLDGSYMCDMLGSTKLTLTVLTNWIVKRAGQIKDRCAELCQGIFDNSGFPLDECEQKEFGTLNAQLLKLYKLESFILKQGYTRFDFDTLESLTKTVKTLCVLNDYQRLLLWFMCKGLLPVQGNETYQQFQHIRRKYSTHRLKMHQNNVKLYIDEHLKQSSCATVLKEHCHQDGLYPPHSMQALMRLLLLPTISQDHKRELVIYLLHDLDSIRAQQNEQLLIVNFAKTFNIDEKTVKPVRCFWLLDNGNIKQSITEFENGYSDWKTKLLVEVLLAHGAKKKAMQVISRLPAGISSSKLELKVLLENNSIPKAFQLARSCMDEKGRQPLLEYFFNYCISIGKFNVLNSLALLDPEELLVFRLLRECKKPQANCAHLIMLLKRHNYIDAAALMNEVEEDRRANSVGERFTIYMNCFLSSYHRSMPPLARALTDKYFLLRDRLSRDRLINYSPLPLSCQLASQNANGKLGDIFENAVLSSYWSTRYVKEDYVRHLDGRNTPFLCKPVQGLQYFFMQAPLLQSKHCGMLVQESQPRVAKRKRGAWAERERKPLQDEILVNALLQPPAYLNLRSRYEGTILSTPQHKQHSKAQSILKKNLSLHATPIPIVKTMPKSYEQQKEHQGKNKTNDLENKNLKQSKNQEKEEDLDEIIMEIEHHQSSPNHDRRKSESDIKSVYSPQQPSDKLFSVDNSQNLSEQDSISRTPPFGPQPRSSLQHISSGFGSLASVRLGNTDSLNLNEFVPPVCSSKMGGNSQIKFSERTTISETFETPTVLATHSWSVRYTTRTETKAAPVAQYLDTTLGMSRFDLTALEPAIGAESLTTNIESPVGFIDIKRRKVEHEEDTKVEEKKEGNTNVKKKIIEDVNIKEKQMELQEQEKQNRTDQMVVDQEDKLETEQLLNIHELEDQEQREEEVHIAIHYNCSSSSFNINRELLDTSSSEEVAPEVNSSIYSIAESSNCSETTRLPTSHATTSLQPSNTNVSENSSPHGTHGTIASRFNRSLYRTNSLETMGDLDTTKGSLEEEDYCIALESTEVRGYVARSESVADSSSAELFNFKKDVGLDNRTSSIFQLSEFTAETLQATFQQLDQDSRTQVDATNECKKNEHLKLVAAGKEDKVLVHVPVASNSPIGSPRRDTSNSSPVSENTIFHCSISQDQKSSAPHGPLKSCLSSFSQTSDEQLPQKVQEDCPLSSKDDLRRGDDANIRRLSQRMHCGDSIEPASSNLTLPVLMPKYHKQSKTLDDNQEEKESPQCISGTTLAAARLRKSRRSSKTFEEKNNVTDANPNCRPILIDCVAKEEEHVLTSAIKVAKHQRRHSTDSSLVSNLKSTENSLPSTILSPIRRRLRSSFQASDEQLNSEVQDSKYSQLSRRGRLHSADDASSRPKQRVLRAGSVPASPIPTSVSMPKGRKRISSNQLDGIQEETDSQSELSVALQLSKRRKASKKQEQDSPPPLLRNLRSRSNTQDADIPAEGPKLLDDKMPPRKRGRPKKT